MKKSPPSTVIEEFLPLALLVAVLLIAILTVYPFLPAILWGVMLAVAIEPGYRWLTVKLDNRPVLAAWLTGIILAMLFIIPAVGLSRALVAYLPDALDWLQDQNLNASKNNPTPFHDLPAIGPEITAIWHSLFDDAGKLAVNLENELKSCCFGCFRR